VLCPVGEGARDGEPDDGEWYIRDLMVDLDGKFSSGQTCRLQASVQWNTHGCLKIGGPEDSVFASVGA
jgi:hypothetical protein